MFCFLFLPGAVRSVKSKQEKAEASRNRGLLWPIVVGMQQPGKATGVSPQPLPRRLGRDLSQESKEQSIREVNPNGFNAGFSDQFAWAKPHTLQTLRAPSSHLLTGEQFSPLSSRNRKTTHFSEMLLALRRQ